MHRESGKTGAAGAVAFALAAMLAGMIAGGRSGLAAGEDAGSSSQESFREAVGALPLDRLAPEDAREVRECLDRTSLYRRLPAQSFDCDSSLLAFSLDHPEVIVDIWRTLDISRLSLDPTGPASWRLADGYGTVGSVRLLATQHTRAGGRMLFLCEGGYTGVLAPKALTGKCLVLLRHRELSSAAAGAVRGTARHAITIDAFLQVDGKGLEIAARTLQPLIVRCAAWNAREICLFISELSDTCGENPTGVALLARRLSRTDPRQRQTLATIATGIAARSAVPSGTDIERLRVELAARWLQPEAIQDLDAPASNRE
jgi:hypothetical protein